MENCFLPNRARALRREAQIRVGPYDESMYYSHDCDTILRLARTNEGVFIDDPVLYQRKHLSYRGPSAEGTFILNTVGEWVKFDAVLFKKLDREWSLSESRPFRDETPSIRREALALLQKGVILFQRKVYDGATRALMECLLGCRYGIADLVSGKNSNGDIVHAFRSRRWPLSMRMAFASQIRWRVRAALTVGDVGYALILSNSRVGSLVYPQQGQF